MRARSSAVALAVAALVARDARATDAAGAPDVKGNAASDPGVTTEEAPNWVLHRKHTIAELELGFIALPTAPISAGQQGGNLPFGTTIGHGDATASVGMHLLYRGGADWAVGAGALFAPNPTSNTYVNASNLVRTHSRDYLWMGGEGRYIPLHLRTIEAWVGIAAGGVVVADRYTTAATPVPSDLGTSQVTVRTEGFSLGLETGGEWSISETVILGLAARFDNWILPANEQCTPIGDCATLNGPVTEIEFGIRLGYRIAL